MNTEIESKMQNVKEKAPVVKEDTSYFTEPNDPCLPRGTTQWLRQSGLSEATQDAIAMLVCRAYERVTKPILRHSYQPKEEATSEDQEEHRNLEDDLKRHFYIVSKVRNRFIYEAEDSSKAAVKSITQIKDVIKTAPFVRSAINSFSMDSCYIPVLKLQPSADDEEACKRAIKAYWNEVYQPRDPVRWKRLAQLRLSTPLDTPGHIRVHRASLLDPNGVAKQSLPLHDFTRLANYEEGLSLSQYRFRLSKSPLVGRYYNGLLGFKKVTRQLLYDQHYCEWLSEIDVHATHPAIAVALAELLTVNVVYKRNPTLLEMLPTMRYSENNESASLWFGGSLFLIHRYTHNNRTGLRRPTRWQVQPERFVDDWSKNDRQWLLDKVCSLPDAMPLDLYDHNQVYRSMRFWQKRITVLRWMFRKDFYNTLLSGLGYDSTDPANRQVAKKAIMRLLHGEDALREYAIYNNMNGIVNRDDGNEGSLLFDENEWKSFGQFTEAIKRKYPEYYFMLLHIRRHFNLIYREAKETNGHKRPIGFSRLLFKIEVEVLELAVSCLRSSKKKAIQQRVNTVSSVLDRAKVNPLGQGQSVITCYDAIFINRSNALVAKRIYEQSLKAYGVRTFCKVTHNPENDEILVREAHEKCVDKILEQDHKDRWQIKIGRTYYELQANSKSEAIEQAMRCTVFFPTTRPKQALAYQPDQPKRSRGKPAMSNLEKIRLALKANKQAILRDPSGNRHRFNVNDGETAEQALDRFESRWRAVAV